jgi:lipid-A-disaccharide synthase
MKYYIIAGEASGDLHGSRLTAALKANDPNSEIRAWGGDLMQKEGANVVKHIRELAIMGIVQVLLKLPQIFRNFSFCHKDIIDFQPNAIILIDYSGFNLRIAKWAKKKGFKVFYFISPQIWATRAGRVEKVKKYVDRMFCVLPFEKDFYAKFGYQADYVGHPLIDIIDNEKNNKQALNIDKTDKAIIALLPGSRRQEIKAILKRMISIVPDFPDFQFVVAAAPSVPIELYQSIIKSEQSIILVQNQTYPLLNAAHAALVTSGTATLETALFEVPQVVCYKTGPIFYWIVRQIIKIPFISLVNIIMGRKIVEELIQGKLNRYDLKKELHKILDTEQRKTISVEYAELRKKLGKKGAADRTSKLIISSLKNN